MQGQDGPGGGHSLSSRNADTGFSPHARPEHNGHTAQHHHRSNHDHQQGRHHDSREPVSARVGNRPRSASRERSPPRRRRDAVEETPDQAPPPRRPRSTVHSQAVAQDVAPESAAGVAAEVPREVRREEARRPAEGADRARSERLNRHAAEDGRDRQRSAAEAPRQGGGRLSSQIVSRTLPPTPGDAGRGSDRWAPHGASQREAPGATATAAAAVEDQTQGIAGSSRFAGRLGTNRTDAPQSRPRGGMRSDATKKWGHDMYESINEEPDSRPPILQRISLF